MHIFRGLCVVLLSFIAGNVWGQATISVSGKITGISGPLQGASVYIAGTSHATITDASGNYTLLNIPNQPFRITVTYVGYNTASVNVVPKSNTIIQDIMLTPKERNLSDVIVTSQKNEKDLSKWLDIFIKTVIGNDKNCQIENKGAIHFSYSDMLRQRETQRLEAFADTLLVIRNNTLGYMVYFDLQKFVYTPARYYFAGHAYYKPLSGSKKQEALWMKNRQNVYEKSSLRFFRALYSNQSFDEDYSLQAITKLSDDGYGYNPIMQKADRNYIIRETNGRVYFNPDTAFLVSLKNQSIYEQLLPNTAPLSSIFDYVTKADTVFIFPDGNIFPRENLNIRGYWGTNEKISTALPSDYISTEKKNRNHARVISSLPAKNTDNRPGTNFEKSLREKLYLHTDKNTYVTGDTLWFKGYLMDALTQKPSVRSGIEYVELVDKNKNCVKRLALHTTYGASYGEIPIDTSYATGKYILRAYTNWMQNFGDSLFFQKEITVTRLKGNWFIAASDPQIQTNNDSTNIRQTFRLTGGTGDPLVLETVAFFVKDNKGKILKQGMLHTNGKGEVTTDYALSKEQSAQNISVEVGRSKDDIVAKLNLFKNKDIDLQFLPESGHLVAGLMNEVGFKAIGSDGKGIDVSGIIKDNTGKEITKFQSLYKGMGTVSFTPEANKTYTAFPDKNKDSILSNTQYSTFNLPAVSITGTVVHIECDNKDSNDISIGLNILATPDLKEKNYTIIGQSRSKEIYKASLTVGDSAFSTFLPKNIFPTGVCSFQLINDKGQIINERAFFVNNFDQLKVTLITPQQTYHPHDSIPVTITVKDKDGKPVVGSFSLAVTDNSQVSRDFTKDQTILSYILLQSDLKGNVETPDYYFINRTDTTSRALDALMLTQGFVKYGWDTIKFKYEAEPEFEVKGRVTNGFNKGVKNAKLTLLSTDKKYTIVKDTTTDDKGYFTFNDFPHFDTTTFVLQSSKKLFGRFGLGMDMQKFNPASVKDLTALDKSQQIGIDTTLINAISQKYKYITAFQKVKGYLPDVVVTANKLSDSHNLNGPGQADQVIGQEEIRQNEDMTLFDLLIQKVKEIDLSERIALPSNPNAAAAQAKGLTKDQQTLMTALSNIPQQYKSPAVANSEPAMDNRVLAGSIGKGTIIDFIFDGVELTKDYMLLGLNQYLQHWLASDIKSIEVITSSKYLKLYRQRFNFNHITYPTSPTSGDIGRYKVVFIEITTYSGNGPGLKVTPGMEYYHPQPFFYGKTFYSPRYTANDKSDSLPDLRSTIFWTPFVVTDDNTGQAQYYFYSADKPAKYIMWLEGMDLNGDIGVGTKKLEIGQNPALLGNNK